MIREIKFRAWDKINSKMLYSDSFTLNGKPMTYAEQMRWFFFHTSNSTPADDYSEIMQFTGYTDSAGKEIYEGDIVELTLDIDRGGLEDRYYNLENAIVVWNSEDGCWDAGDSRLSTYVDDKDWEHRCEVFGNIYQNPEMVEGIRNA